MGKFSGDHYFLVLQKLLYTMFPFFIIDQISSVWYHWKALGPSMKDPVASPPFTWIHVGSI